jgi:hypothetical protein
MFFNLERELILRHKHEGKSLYQFILGSEKDHIVRKLSGQINTETRDAGMYLKYADDHINVVEEAVNRVPMLLNLLKNREYQNILFVGHFNSGQSSWVLDKFAGRVIDIMPEERDQLHSVADQNIIVQFLPLLHKAMGYKGTFSVCRPPETHHRGLMHSMYRAAGLKTLATTTQYKHGMTSDNFAISAENVEKFDAVVFLGCPKVDGNVSFSVDRVRQLFAPLCTEGFELVDLYYGAPMPSKWKNGVEKSVAVDLDVVWSNRSLWDSEIKKNGASPEELDVLKRTVKVF